MRCGTSLSGTHSGTRRWHSDLGFGSVALRLLAIQHTARASFTPLRPRVHFYSLPLITLVITVPCTCTKRGQRSTCPLPSVRSPALSRALRAHTACAAAYHCLSPPPRVPFALDHLPIGHICRSSHQRRELDASAGRLPCGKVSKKAPIASTSLCRERWPAGPCISSQVRRE